MLYDRKIMGEVINNCDIELPFIEYKASIYDEIVKYLSDNNCSEGAILVNNIKEKIDNYAISIKDDLDEYKDNLISSRKLVKKLRV